MGVPLTKLSGRSSVRLAAALLICSDLLAEIVSTINRRLAKEGNLRCGNPVSPKSDRNDKWGASDETIRKKQCLIGGGTFDLFRSAGRNRQHDKQTIGQRGKYCVAPTLYHPRVTEMTSGGVPLTRPSGRSSV